MFLSQWHTIIQTSRATAPYLVIPLTHEDIYDFKEVASGLLRKTKLEMKGKRVNWMGIKWLRFMKTEPDTFYYNYRMFENFKILKIRGTSRRKSSKRISFGDILPSRYSSRIPISDKKMDLLGLCRLGVS